MKWCSKQDLPVPASPEGRIEETSRYMQDMCKYIFQPITMNLRRKSANWMLDKPSCAGGWGCFKTLTISLDHFGGFIVVVGHCQL